MDMKNLEEKLKSIAQTGLENNDDMLESIKTHHGEEMHSVVAALNEIYLFHSQLMRLVGQMMGPDHELVKLLQDTGGNIMIELAAASLYTATDRSKPKEARLEEVQKVAKIGAAALKEQQRTLSKLKEVVNATLPKSQEDNE